MEFRVNIYISTSRRGPSKGPGKYMYVIEFLSKKTGEPITREGMENFENTFENELALKAIIAAAKKLNKKCAIRVFTECSYVYNSMNAGWPVQWKKSGWIKSKDKPVKNAELWQELLEIMEKHVVTYTKEDHSYKSWMKEQMEEKDV